MRTTLVIALLVIGLGAGWLTASAGSSGGVTTGTGGVNTITAPDPSPTPESLTLRVDALQQRVTRLEFCFKHRGNSRCKNL